MAIHLNADQKNIKNLYVTYDTFVIPPYQRPYSWTVNECRQLYDDLIDAFLRGKDSDYFVGTIILAVADKDDNVPPRIIDGQQRLATFWLLFKALSALLPDVTTITDCLYSKEWDGSGKKLRILSLVNDRNDRSEMEGIDTWKKKDYNAKVAAWEERARQSDLELENCLNEDGRNQENASVFFYKRLCDMGTEWPGSTLREFARFLLTSVYILPIEMHAPGIRDAEDKALTIFETINNRGMELSNSDIFKARLYSKALTSEQRDQFIEMWDTVVKNCKEISIDIDHLFSIYMLLIASQRRMDTRISDIREFFDGRNGVLSHSSYTQVMEDLTEISDILSLYKSLSRSTTPKAGWLQMLNVGANAKVDAVLVAWKKNDGHDGADEDSFLCKLVKLFLARPYSIAAYMVTRIIRDLQDGRMPQQLLANASSLKGGLPIRQDSEMAARLALIVEMGGGLLPSKYHNLTWRNGVGTTGWVENDGRPVLLDLSLGNLAFVPIDGAACEHDYKVYIERLRRVDPECAALVDDEAIKFSAKDIKERAQRKTKALKAFFNDVQ